MFENVRPFQTPMMHKDSDVADVLMVLKFQSNSPVVHLAAHTHPSLHVPAVVTCTKNLHFCVNKWNDVGLFAIAIVDSNPKNVSYFMQSADIKNPSAEGDEPPRFRLIEPDPLSKSTLGFRSTTLFDFAKS